MKKEAAVALNVEQIAVSNEVEIVHPLKKSYTLISTKHVDYENLNAFEAVTLSVALFMAVTIGTLMSITIS